MTGASTPTVRRLRTAGALLLVLLAAGACRNVSVTSLGVTAVEVRPAEVTLPVGDGRILEAVPTGENGTAVTGRTVEWFARDGGVAIVDGRGLVIAVGPGATVVEASVDGVVGEASVRVVPRNDPGNGDDEGEDDEGGEDDEEEDEEGEDDDGEEDEPNDGNGGGEGNGDGRGRP